MPLIGNVLKLLARMILIPLVVTAAASALDVAIHEKMFGSAGTTWIIFNQIMKIVKSLKEAGLLINCVAQTIKNEVQEQKRVFPGMILGTLGASFLGNLLADKKR